MRLSKTISIDTATSLEFKPILKVLNTELWLYNILNKYIESLLEISGSDIGIISEVST